MSLKKTALATTVASLFALSAQASPIPDYPDWTAHIINASSAPSNLYQPGGAETSNIWVRVDAVPTGHTGTLKVFGADLDSAVDGDVTAHNWVTIDRTVRHLEDFYLVGGLVSGTGANQEANDNAVSVSGVLKATGNNLEESVILGGGNRLARPDYYQHSNVNATRNSVVIACVDVGHTETPGGTIGGTGDVVLVGAAGHTVEANGVTLNNATMTDGNVTTVLGGDGHIAKNNSVQIIGGDYDFSNALEIAGGRGYEEAMGNYLTISDGSNIRETGYMISGGVSAKTATKNHLEIDNADGVVNGVFSAAGLSPIVYTSAPEELVEITAKENKASVTGVADGSELTMAGTIHNLTAVINSRITDTDNVVSVKNVDIEDVYGTVVLTSNETASSMTNANNTIAIENAAVDNVYLAYLINADDPATPSGNVSIDFDGSKVMLKNATVRGDLKTVRSENLTTSMSGHVLLTAEGINRIGKLGSEFKRLTLNVGAVNAAGGAAPATYALRRATPSNAVLTFTEGQTLTGLDLTIVGLPGTSGTDYNLLAADTTDGSSVVLSGTMNFVGTFVQASQSLSGYEVSNGSVATLGQVIAAGGTTSGGTTPPVVTLTGNVKTLAESQLGTVALINQGAEFIANEGMDALTAAAKDDEAVVAFGALRYGSSRYETGSYVDLDGGAMTVGGALRNGGTVVAGFFETGWADSESHVAQTKADGDHKYYGVGLAARHTFETPFYVEGSLRVGQGKTEFDGIYATTGEKAHYDAKAKYTSMHVGAGYLFKITDDVTLDTYAKYLYTSLGSDKVKLGTAGGEKLKLDSTQAHTLQIGARATGSFCESSTWRVGAAYQRVFDGDAETAISVNGLGTLRIEAPSLEGNIAVMEVGVSMKPDADSAWSFDLGAKGYAGDRKGVTGSVQAVYRW